MIVQYNKIRPENRNQVRAFENKSYVNFVRYMLLKQFPHSKIQKELMRLGMSWDEKHDYAVYFKEVILPVLKRYDLQGYFRLYRQGSEVDPLKIKETFKGSDEDRIKFIDAMKELETEEFFLEEISQFYGGMNNLPPHPDTGKPILANEQPVDLVTILRSPHRSTIEELLVEGYDPSQIREHLYQRFDVEMTERDIKTYAKTFFNVQRQDIKKLIANLEQEKDDLQNRLTEAKQRPSSEYGFGERFTLLSTLSSKIEKVTKMIQRLSSVHTRSSYGESLLEITDVREMFQDVMVRSHRRYREMDERTEDEVVSNLNTIVGMMGKASKQILDIDGRMSEKETKSINEEMLEVLGPTIERLEEEEREIIFQYKEANKSNDKDDDDEDDDDDEEIIGFEK